MNIWSEKLALEIKDTDYSIIIKMKDEKATLTLVIDPQHVKANQIELFFKGINKAKEIIGTQSNIDWTEIWMEKNKEELSC